MTTVLHRTPSLPAVTGRTATALALLFLGSAFGPGPQPAAAAPASPAVRCAPQVIMAGEEATCSFQLPEPATITATMEGPDGLPIATLANGQQRPAGTVSLTWNGRDDSGAPVPDEAYGVNIEFVWPDGSTGRTAAWAQATDSRLPVSLNVTETEDSVLLSFTLPEPARVRILAGIQNGGPLLRTILPGVPQAAGPHQLRWDGLDDTGHVQVNALPGWGATITATPLPAGVVIVQGNGGDYLSYSKQQRGNAQAARTSQGTRHTVRGAGTPRFTVLGQPAGARTAQGATPVRQPLAGEAPVPASGIFDLTVLIDKTYQDIFDQTRFETVIFIDGKRFDEEENAFSPYTYRLDTRRLANGPHLVTINQVGLTGEIGSYSFTLDVRN